jgi:endonuclease/exonuclease/phosphatase family metal-dependent hydrolase
MPRVATYNVRHCRGMDGVVDVARTAHAIVSTGAGFVALQEIDRHRARSGDVDQPARLAELSGLDLRFWPTLSGDDGEYGLAIAIAGDIGADEFITLPKGGEGEPRGAIIARWREITLIATHLAKESRGRRLQLRALAEVAKEARPPVVILGDLNCPRRGLAPLLRAGFDPGPPLPTRQSPLLPQIDYILSGPGLDLEAAWSVQTTASDHLPVVAEVAAPSA